ncbi:MAG: ABC transporter permease [Alphaproteobacteria bacterium]|nr:ABC transporter permease [Alphaproteobacteria bacterium]
MLRFATGRLIESLAVLLIMSWAVYLLIGLMPGDPIDLMIAANPNFTSADADRLKALHGLDKPIMERYGNWLLAALQGDFGYSRTFTKPALEILLPRLFNTFLLMGLSLLFSLAIAIPLGVYAALRPYSRADYAVNMLCFAGISVPSFWLALLCIILFAVRLQWLPAGGMETIGDGGMLDRARYLILPVLVLTVASIGGFTRFVRASMMQTLRQDYIRTALAKGVGSWRLVVHHALRNALLPLVTVVGLSFGNLFSGALITEIMFSWLGMGKMMYDAILGNDFNLALVGLLFATSATLIGNFLADVGQVALDPRVSFAARSSEE